MSPAAIAAARVVVPEDRIVILAAWLSEALGSERLTGLWALRRQRDWRTGFAPALTAPLLPLSPKLKRARSLASVESFHDLDAAHALAELVSA